MSDIEGTRLLPPLLEMAAELRDHIEWGTAERLSPEVTVRPGAVPYCKGPVDRVTVNIPDVHISAFTVLFQANDSAIPDVSNDELTHLGPLLRLSSTSSSSSSTDPEPPSQASIRKAEMRQHYGLWFEPRGHHAVEFDRLAETGGGFDLEAPSCPTWFPAALPEDCPLSDNEEGFYCRIKSPFPGVQPRDMIGRSLPLVDYSNACHLTKEALGTTSEEVYAFAAVSCTGMMPALKNVTRGAGVYLVVLQGPGSGRLGVVADFFTVSEFVGNSLLNSVVRRALLEDYLHVVRLCRWLHEEFKGRPIELGDKAAHAVAVRLAQEIRRTRRGDRDHIGAEDLGCSGPCSVQ